MCIVQDLGSTSGATESEWGLKDLALLVEVVAKLVVDLVAQISPDEPSNMPSVIASEVPHLPQSACENDDAL